MSLTTGVLRDDALRAVPGGCEVDVYLAWYRSLPLSSVVRVEAAVDGQAIAPGDISFSINGQDYAVDELPAHWQEWWFVQDAATLRISGATVPPGSRAKIAVTLGWRIPYIIIGPQMALTHLVRSERRLVADGGQTGKEEA